MSKAIRWGMALGSGAVGLPYIMGAFGPTEAEVRTWGLVALATGIVLSALALAAPRAHGAWRIGGAWAMSLQALPVAMWVIFHGRGISDGSPPSPFVAHWAYALPHVAVAALGLWTLLDRPRTSPSAR